MKKDGTWLRQMAWLNEQWLKKPICGVALSFHGLGGGIHGAGASPFELACADLGVLLVHPHYGPWSWMNREARQLVDELVALTYAEFKLGADVPLISTGGSMGGGSALIYTRYGKKTPNATLAIYPVCDMVYHYTERPDLPISFYCAYGHYAEPIEDVLVEHSPLAQADKFPDIPYLFIHGDADKAVNKQHHSDKMVAALRERGRKVDYLEIPGMGHGDNSPLLFTTRQIDFIAAQV
jgi:acetyl esterase/lipase